MGGFHYSSSNSREEKISSSKNSVSDISNPFASIITVLNVTVLFRPFIIHCILPCCIPDFCSNLYWDISFSCKSRETRLATALFTVKKIHPNQKLIGSIKFLVFALVDKLTYERGLRNEVLVDRRNHFYGVKHLACIFVARCKLVADKVKHVFSHNA